MHYTMRKHLLQYIFNKFLYGAVAPYKDCTNDCRVSDFNGSNSSDCITVTTECTMYTKNDIFHGDKIKPTSL